MRNSPMSLLHQSGIVTRQISAENPTGGKGAGCKWEPDPANPDLPYSGAALDFGRGWKVRPYIRCDSDACRSMARAVDLSHQRLPGISRINSADLLGP